LVESLARPGANVTGFLLFEHSISAKWTEIPKEIALADVIDVPKRYLELAVQYFERAEQADSPALQAKYRELAGDYRDKALEMLNAPAKAAVAAVAERRSGHFARPPPRALAPSSRRP
jgi:hypothetical protein